MTLRHLYKTVLLAGFVILEGIQGQVAFAYDWSNSYGTSISAGYDDNFRLSETDETETSSSTIRVFGNTTGSTEISSLRFSASVSGNTYSESSIEDSDSLSLAFNGERRGERLSGTLGLALDSQSTTETELLDSGAVIDGTRDTLSLSPGLSYLVNERNVFTVNLSARDVTYDTVSLAEFTDNSASIGWRFKLDESSDISATLRSSQFDPEDGDTTDTTTINLGYDINSSEATRYSFTVGFNDVDRPDDSESGSSFSIDINYSRDERNSFAAVLGNRYQSSGQGEVRNEDHLNLLWDHGLSERSRLNVMLEGVSNDDRDYSSIQLGGRYQATRAVSLGASLRYRQQDTDTTQADSSSVFFSLSYTPL